MVVIDSAHSSSRQISYSTHLYKPLKVAADFVVGLLLFVLCLPLIAVLALLVRLTSRGPAIFRQRRVGQGGRPFTLYKMRTMYRDAEVKTGPVWATADDPRVTPLGRFLRRSHLDELPQLINVLKGEMSLVGPRPERPEFVTKLASEIPGYLERLNVRPGITGLAQLYLPPDHDFDDVRLKLLYDRQYIDQLGLRLDAKLLFCTVFRLFKLPHEIAHKIARLDLHLRPLELPEPLAAARPLMTNSPAQD